MCDDTREISYEREIFLPNTNTFPKTYTVIGTAAHYVEQGLHISCPSVHLSMGSQQQTSCYRFVAVDLAGRRYRLIAARHTATQQTNAGCATLSAYVGS